MRNTATLAQHSAAQRSAAQHSTAQHRLSLPFFPVNMVFKVHYARISKGELRLFLLSESGVTSCE